MVRLLRPFGRAVTYTRWLHLFIATVWPAMWMFVEEAWWTWLVAAATLAPVGLVPAMRTVEGLQARLLLTGHRHDSESLAIVVAPSASWGDRGKLVVWLETRLLLGYATAFLSVQLLTSTVDLVASAFGRDVDEGVLVVLDGHQWWHILFAPLSLAALAATVLGAGRLVTALALRLLGPSPPTASPPWRNAPSNSWSAPASRASCTIR